MKLTDIFSMIEAESERQERSIELIASENIASSNVKVALGSAFTNKYAEGYPGRRYYGGCGPSDQVESAAIDLAKHIFKAQFANVQPHSGSQANQAVFLSLLQPGDRILGMALDAGGHLTHGASVNLSGRWFDAHTYGVNNQGLIDYDEVEAQARALRPKLIIAGGSAYPRVIDFARFRAIADAVGALLLADVSHYAGLIVGGVYPNPLPYADVVTTTTHKTLRGPRGGLILTNDAKLAKQIDKAIFPGLQGGPLMHVIAAKAVAFWEASQPSFDLYAANVLTNARAMARRLEDNGLDLVSGGTDSHLILIDLRALDISGRDLQLALEAAGITTNKNGVPNDNKSPMLTSGLRIGTPACTTRGFGICEFTEIADVISHVAYALRDGDVINKISEASVKVSRITSKHRLIN